MKNTSYGDATQTKYVWLGSLKIVPRTEKIVLLLTKLGRKHENGDFWRCPSNHVSVVTTVGNRVENLKSCHENVGRKHEKHEFSWILSNHVSVVTVAGNRPGNQKCVLFLMEMGRNHSNYELLRHHSNHVSVITIAKKISWEPKIVCYNQREWAENMKMASFSNALKVLATPV
jgi:hypothetical protein